MSEQLAPATADEAATALREAAERRQPIETGGAFSQRRAGGAIAEPSVRVSTAGLNRILAYEPKDLTISVEAGMRFAELQRELAENNQILPLDPPRGDQASVGGVIAVNGSGPRRRRYGTARDMVIGMTFATVDGNLVDSGGMVVKNVTGLDMAKLMIGSYGTLGLMTKVNFKVFPKPPATATFAFRSSDARGALKLRAAILKSQLQPIALDLLNPPSSGLLGMGDGYQLIAEAAGSEPVLRRYEASYQEFARSSGAEARALGSDEAGLLWAAIRGFRSTVELQFDQAAVVRISTTPTRLAEALEVAADAYVLGRAAEAILYAVCSGVAEATSLTERLRAKGFATTIEEAPQDLKEGLEMWSVTGSQFEVMKRLKQTLDPNSVLNPGRLLNRI